jgi:FtsH-binding integral membrane protein
MTYSTARMLMMVLGVAYVLFGVLGFVPGITQPGERPGQGLLLGIFAVNTIHNIAHLVLGAWMVWAASSRENLRMHGRILAVLFVVLAIGSFVAPLVEGLALNVADSGLHILTAVLAGLVAFATRWTDEDVQDGTTPTAAV